MLSRVLRHKATILRRYSSQLLKELRKEVDILKQVGIKPPIDISKFEKAFEVIEKQMRGTIQEYIQLRELLKKLFDVYIHLKKQVLDIVIKSNIDKNIWFALEQYLTPSMIEDLVSRKVDIKRIAEEILQHLDIPRKDKEWKLKAVEETIRNILHNFEAHYRRYPAEMMDRIKEDVKDAISKMEKFSRLEKISPELIRITRQALEREIIKNISNHHNQYKETVSDPLIHKFLDILYKKYLNKFKMVAHKLKDLEEKWIRQWEKRVEESKEAERVIETNLKVIDKIADENEFRQAVLDLKKEWINKLQDEEKKRYYLQQLLNIVEEREKRKELPVKIREFIEKYYPYTRNRKVALDFIVRERENPEVIARTAEKYLKSLKGLTRVEHTERELNNIYITFNNLIPLTRHLFKKSKELEELMEKMRKEGREREKEEYEKFKYQEKLRKIGDKIDKVYQMVRILEQGMTKYKLKPEYTYDPYQEKFIPERTVFSPFIKYPKDLRKLISVVKQEIKKEFRGLKEIPSRFRWKLEYIDNTLKKWEQVAKRRAKKKGLMKSLLEETHKVISERFGKPAVFNISRILVNFPLKHIKIRANVFVEDEKPKLYRVVVENFGTKKFYITDVSPLLKFKSEIKPEVKEAVVKYIIKGLYNLIKATPLEIPSQAIEKLKESVRRQLKQKAPVKEERLRIIFDKGIPKKLEMVVSTERIEEVKRKRGGEIISIPVKIVSIYNVSADWTGDRFKNITVRKVSEEKEQIRPLPEPKVRGSKGERGELMSLLIPTIRGHEEQQQILWEQRRDWFGPGQMLSDMEWKEAILRFKGWKQRIAHQLSEIKEQRFKELSLLTALKHELDRIITLKKIPVKKVEALTKIPYNTLAGLIDIGSEIIDAIKDLENILDRAKTPQEFIELTKRLPTKIKKYFQIKGYKDGVPFVMFSSLLVKYADTVERMYLEAVLDRVVEFMKKMEKEGVKAGKKRGLLRETFKTDEMRKMIAENLYQDLHTKYMWLPMANIKKETYVKWIDEALKVLGVNLDLDYNTIKRQYEKQIDKFISSKKAEIWRAMKGV